MDKKKEADTLLIYYKHAAPVEIGDFTKSLNGLCGYFFELCSLKRCV